MENQKQLIQLSKFLSLVLRHKPEQINLKLDKEGWANTEELIEKINQSGRHFTLDMLKQIVDEDNKGRYSFSEDFESIRANQGHSIKVDLKLKKSVPPVKLYHGTPEKFVEPILKKGLLPMNRHHVHLSGDLETAINVGERRGKAVIFEVDAKQMLADGINFYLSDNGVWLVDSVESKYLSIKEK